MNKSIFVLTKKATGPGGHGEPGEPYMTLATDGDGYSLGKPYPCFSDRETAKQFNAKLSVKYTITELTLWK